MLLLLASLALLPLDLGEEIVDVLVADIDADGKEDVVAISKTHLFLLRGGRLPAVKRPAPRLTVAGRGLLGVVRDGRYHAVSEPFGEWNEGAPGARSLLAALGRGEPALLRAAGDLDGDGKDDPVLCGPQGFTTPDGLVPVVPEAELQIGRNETLAVEYRIPLPVVGNWTGRGRELVFHHGNAVRAFRGTDEGRSVPIPLPARDAEAEAIRRNHVALRDIDGDERLDMLIVVARGKTDLFTKFESTVRFFRGGHIYDHKKKRFYRPSALKVSGVLLKSHLLDVDGDGDLDLVLCSIDISIFSMATGSAPGTYHVFAFDKDAYKRKPRWTLRAPVPLSAFTDRPEPPVRFLPDYDGNGRPAALALDDASIRVHEYHATGQFFASPVTKVERPGRPAIGRTRTAVPHANGVVVVEAAK